MLSLLGLFRAEMMRWKYYTTSMTLEELHHKAFDRLLKGISLDSLEKYIPEFLKQLLPQAIYQPAYQELQAAKKNGCFTAILSSSPSFIVQPFAEYFGVDAWDATTYGVDKDRRLCKIAKLVVGTEKVRYLVELQRKFSVSKEEVTVYTDSHDDIPLLLQAGEAVAVNPDRKLRKMARRHKWRVI